MSRSRRLRRCAALVVAGVLVSLAAPVLAATASPRGVPGIAVSGNRIVTTSAGLLGVRRVASGQAVVLRGVNLSGAEYSCLTGSFWDRPKGTHATIERMRKGWHANVVRLPLNEGCWLGLSGRRATRGARYRSEMAGFVRRATSSGLVAEVDLHFGVDRTSDNYPALDAAHASAFWTSVADTFKANPSVIFNLINEPHGISWKCYRDGCSAGNGPGYAVVGTQAVVDAIRATGSTNPIIVAGLDWSDDLSKWPQWVPTDPAGQLIAGFHPYFGLGNRCERRPPKCWNREVAPIQTQAGTPVIANEMGEVNDKCAGTSIERFMHWADSQKPKIGYWAWAFTVGSCSQGPSLISDAKGAPTKSYGIHFRKHLRSVQ